MGQWRTTSRVIAASVAGIILVTGCVSSSSSDSSSQNDDRGAITTAELSLTDDYQIVARQIGADPGDWSFTIEGDNGPPDPSLRYAWQFGSGRFFEGLEQNYIFGSTGIYPVRVQAETADGSVLFTLQTLIEVIIPGAPNLPPTANAGADQVIDEGAVGTLDGSASSDADSFSLNYQWRQTGGDPFAVITNADQAVATFVAPMVTEDTTIEFTLSVIDDTQFSIDRVLVVIRDVDSGGFEPAAPPPDVTSDGADTGGGIDGGGAGDGSSGGGGPAGGSGGGTGLTENLPHVVVVATDEGDLVAASTLSIRNNVTVLVANDITVNDGIQYNDDAIVRILGVGDHPTINFNLKFNGDWNDPSNFGNGFHFANRQSVLRNLRITGFDRKGSAVKARVAELLDVSDCRFEDAGTTVYPYRVTPPQSSSDAVLSMMVGGHLLSRAHLNIAGNQFLRCSSHNQRWAHSLYISARSITVADNTFTQTGNPFAIGASLPYASNAIIGNLVQDPVSSPLPDGSYRPAYLSSLDETEPTIHMYNTVSGHFFAPWSGSPNPAVNYVGQNDYTNMTYSGVWASDTANGVTVPWDDWQALGFDAGPDQVPSSTVTVRTEAQLRTAASRTASENLNILVDASITLTEPLVFPSGDQVVRLLGIGNHAVISFQMPFDGNYANPSNYAVNGIEFNGRTALVRNLTFEDFNLMGAAVMGRTSVLFDISDCAFNRCGNVAYAPRVSPPATASDVIHTFCVAADSNIDAHVAVTRCSFDQCATNQWEWSRCLSLGGRSVSVMNNTFTRSGTPFDVGGRYIAEGNHILGNSISQPATAPNAAGVSVAPRLLNLHDEDHTAFSFNTVSGQFNQPWGYTDEIANHYVGQNDYTNMTYTGAWATNMNSNGTMTFAEWQALGFDQ